jgi:hypothetical protein
MAADDQRFADELRRAAEDADGDADEPASSAAIETCVHPRSSAADTADTASCTGHEI